MTRVAIGELVLGAEATISGRIVACDEAARNFVLRDGSGEIRVVVAAGAAPPPPGALASVAGRFEKRGFVATRIEVASVPRLRAGEAAEWADAGWTRKRGELVARDRMLRALRRWFHEQRFVEVETPLLLAAPGQEPHLLPFATAYHGRAGARPLWLATSPEYALKRLLAVGCERIFQLGKSFRDGRDELSPMHAPEFTLLEWYRAWEPLGAIGRDVEALLRAAAAAVRGDSSNAMVLERAGRRCDLSRPANWLPVEWAFREHAVVDLEPYLDGDDAAFVASLPKGVPRVGATPREQADSAYFRLLIERIEPRLGVGSPTFLCKYPARHAALAELCPDDPRVAERFEAYVLGVELCNAFQELRDPDEQERRLRAESAERVAAHGEAAALPISEEFLRALRAGLPPCAGIALGVDRLHQLITGADAVADVQPFPLAPDPG